MGRRATMWMNASKVDVIIWPLALTLLAVSIVCVMKDMKDLECSARISTNAVKELTAVTQQVGVRTQLDLTSVWTAQQAMSVMAPTVRILTSVKRIHTIAMPRRIVWTTQEASSVSAKEVTMAQAKSALTLMSVFAMTQWYVETQFQYSAQPLPISNVPIHQAVQCAYVRVDFTCRRVCAWVSIGSFVSHVYTFHTVILRSTFTHFTHYHTLQLPRLEFSLRPDPKVVSYTIWLKKGTVARNWFIPSTLCVCLLRWKRGRELVHCLYEKNSDMFTNLPSARKTQLEQYSLS